MTDLIEVPGSIEGGKILIKGLKIQPEGRPRKNKILGLVFPIKVERNGQGIIKEELNPKKCRIQETSLLNINDSISGKHLWGFSTAIIKPGQIQKGGLARTSSHTRQHMSIQGSCCYFTLIHGYKGLPISIHPKGILLDK